MERSGSADLQKSMRRLIAVEHVSPKPTGLALAA